MNDDIVTVPVEVEHTATVPVEAIEPEEPQLDPNKLLEADILIAQTEAQTEQARIAARTAVKIAEIQAEEPSWLSDIRECLMRLETKMEAALESRQSSTPQASTVIVTEPEAPTVVETTPEPEPVVDEVTPELNEALEEPPVARPRRRWI